MSTKNADAAPMAMVTQGQPRNLTKSAVAVRVNSTPIPMIVNI